MPFYLFFGEGSPTKIDHGKKLVPVFHLSTGGHRRRSINQNPNIVPQSQAQILHCHGHQCQADLARGVASVLLDSAGGRRKFAAASIHLGYLDRGWTSGQRDSGTREFVEQCEQCPWNFSSWRTHCGYIHPGIASIWSGQQLGNGLGAAKSLAGDIAWLLALCLAVGVRDAALQNNSWLIDSCLTHDSDSMTK